MSSRLLLDVRRMKVIPTQELEYKIGYLAVIRDIYPSTGPGNFPTGDFVIDIDNLPLRTTDSLNLSREELEGLLNFYSSKNKLELLGKKGIGIYTEQDSSLTGFIAF